MANLDIEHDTVWTNLFYLLPAPPAFLLGAIPGLLVLAGSLNLFYHSGRYHTTYDRKEQGGDAAAMLTYLAILIGVVFSLLTPWTLLLPLVAAPLHRRFVWHIDSYVAAPIYIVVALVGTAVQVGTWALIPAGFAVAGGVVKLKQPGPKTAAHSFWHVFGGGAAGSALLLLWFVS